MRITHNQQGDHGQMPSSRDLPRSIISRDARSVDRLLSALSLDGPAAAAAWRFLMRLPTNPDMLSAVMSLEEVRSDAGPGVGGKDKGEGELDGEGGLGRERAKKWKGLLGPPGSHRMLYMLQIVEGLLEHVTGSGGEGAGYGRIGGGETDGGWLDNVQWTTDFVLSGGFGQLCEAVLAGGLFWDKHPESMVDVQQACLVREVIGAVSFDAPRGYSVALCSGWGRWSRFMHRWQFLMVFEQTR